MAFEGRARMAKENYGEQVIVGPKIGRASWNVVSSPSLEVWTGLDKRRGEESEMVSVLVPVTFGGCDS